MEESAYTPEQLLGYDKFWDIIRTEKTYYGSALRRGLAEGHAKGRAEGIEEGRAEERAKVVLNMRSMGLSDEMIAQATGLTIEEIRHTDK